MLKKTKISVSLIAIILLFSSCEEWLDLYPPDGLVKSEYWEHKEDVEATLMGAYRTMGDLNTRLFYYGELRADMLKQGQSLSDNSVISVMDGNIYPDNYLSDWGDFYTAINYCNTVLAYSADVKDKDPTFSEYQYQALNAEAVFVRSLAYFYLVRVFKDVPLVLKPHDTDDQDFFPEKSKASVVLDTLEAQLLRVRNSIPLTRETQVKSRCRATRGAVNALLTDIALWNFEYEKTIQYADRVINNEEYKLLPTKDWFKIFSQGATLEGIFEFYFSQENNQSNGIAGLTNGGVTMDPQIAPSEKAYEFLEPGPTGEVVRGNGSVSPGLDLIWKYIGGKPDGQTKRTSVNLSSANWIVYRLADIKLMKAEALSQLGRYDEALSIVNEIRERANMPALDNVQQTAQAFEDVILAERAKEFAFEGKRWFDILRMGRRNNYNRKTRLIEIIVENVPATQKRVLASKLTDPNGWYMPIQADEIERNLNLEQNPYYKIYMEDDIVE